MFDHINGSVAILCNAESLNYAENLIKAFTQIKHISLYIEHSNKVILYANINKSTVNAASHIQLEGNLKQCFSPFEYSCTICLGESSCFTSIASYCKKYATPVYILDSFKAA